MRPSTLSCDYGKAKKECEVRIMKNREAHNSRAHSLCLPSRPRYTLIYAGSSGVEIVSLIEVSLVVKDGDIDDEIGTSEGGGPSGAIYSIRHTHSD